MNNLLKLTKKQKISAVAFLGVVMLIVCIINSQERSFAPVEDNPQPLIDITKVLDKTVAEVDAYLGTPTSVHPITNEGYQGEFREYRIVGATDPVSVHFKENKALCVQIYFDEPEDMPENIALKAGVDVNQLQKGTVAPYGRNWSGFYKNTYFEKLQVVSQDENRNWYILTAFSEMP